MPTLPLSIWLIDDDRIYQFTVQKMIESINPGIHLLAFYDGKDAVQFLSDEKNRTVDKLPDVIFLDIQMPIMNGWDFLEKYAEYYPSFQKKVRLYMVSSSMDTVDIKRAKKYPSVTDYIIKPLTASHYRNILRGDLPKQA